MREFGTKIFYTKFGIKTVDFALNKIIGYFFGIMKWNIFWSNIIIAWWNEWNEGDIKFIYNNINFSATITICQEIYENICKKDREIEKTELIKKSEFGLYRVYKRAHYTKGGNVIWCTVQLNQENMGIITKLLR